jgi:hypothetical protein
MRKPASGPSTSATATARLNSVRPRPIAAGVVQEHQGQESPNLGVAGNAIDEAHSYAGLGRTELAADRWAAAGQHLRAALALFTEVGTGRPRRSPRNSNGWLPDSASPAAV